MYPDTATELTTLREILDEWDQGGALYFLDDCGSVYELESIEEILEYYYDDEMIVSL